MTQIGFVTDATYPQSLEKCQFLLNIIEIDKKLLKNSCSTAIFNLNCKACFDNLSNIGVRTDIST